VAIVCSAVVLCTYHQTYDLVLLAAPAVAMATGALASGRAVPGWTRWALGLSLIALASNYMVSGTALARLGLRGGWWIAAVSLNGAAVLTILAVCIGLAFRRQQPATVLDSATAPRRPRGRAYGWPRVSQSSRVRRRRLGEPAPRRRFLP
jgi:hypothetical protein